MTTPSLAGITEQQREKIRRQLEWILDSPQFRNSKRCPSLLRHVVVRALEGETESLKERAIGIDVFGREPDYDTNVDHIVRTTAGEVRKRLAQYYQETSGRGGQIRIDLPAGSYAPQFRWPEEESSPESARVAAPRVLAGPSHRWQWYSIALACVVLLGLLIFWRMGPPTRDRSMSRFWGPVWASSNPVVLCVGSQGMAVSIFGLPAPTLPDYLPPLTDLLSIDDAVTMARLAGFLQANGKRYHILTESQATLSDLRGAPSILIGGFNNYWTYRFAGELRFSFIGGQTAGQTRYGIVDKKNPSRQDWIMEYEPQSPGLRRDYAIITRFIDPTTEQLTVVAGGRTKWGTLAAGEFLTNSSYMAKLEPVAPQGWEHRNLQLVIATDIIRGISGPPSIVASQFW